jgi:dinuclear metal center YbgI/SA1388 family protein
MVKRNELIKYIEEIFADYNFSDYSYNGLQFEGKEEVKKIIAGVDATVEFFDQAIKKDGDFAFVHHGLFWKGGEWTSLNRIKQRMVKLLIKGDLNLFAMHLPLDAHLIFGNNAQMANLLEAEVKGPFGAGRNPVGVMARLEQPVTLTEFKQKIEKLIGPINTSLDFGKEKVQNIGITSGGGWSSVNAEAVYNGEIDLILTGEIIHQGVAACRDVGVNMVSAGHYATEVFGVQALAKHLAEKFGLEYEFIDLPTGL